MRFSRLESGQLASKPGFEAVWYADQWLVANSRLDVGPADAYAWNYAVVRDILESAGVQAPLLTYHSMRTHMIAVSDAQWADAVSALTQAGESSALYASMSVVTSHRKKVREAVFTGNHRFADSAHGADTLDIYSVGLPTAGGKLVAGRYACKIQRWGPKEDSDALAAPEANATASYVAADAFDSLVETTDMFGVRELRFRDAPYPHFSVVNFPIDLVYFWVDGNDPAWQARRKEYSPETQTPTDGTGDWLFRDRNELLYSLRSVELHAPWVRKIHLFTAGQVPGWLDTTSERIQVHSHDDVFSDPDALPTFNSHAIGSQAHRIPGLSEHYMIMNDDVLFGAPVEPELFFTAAGLPRIRRSTIHAPLAPRDQMNAIENARHNAADLVERKHGIRPSQLFAHTPVPQIRSFGFRLEEEFAKEYSTTARSRFRSPKDVETNSWLQINMLEATGRATTGYVRYGYFYLVSSTARDGLARALREGRTQVICMNDGPDQDGEDYEDWLVTTLAATYPQPSVFERGG